MSALHKDDFPEPAPAKADPEPGDLASPEEKDAWWFRNVYQGDRMPQLTLRAVVMGGLLGMIMSVSNLYTTLKVGWSFGVAITSCVLSYVLWNALVTLSGSRLTRMSILENNCMQSTASAAGFSTGSTIATCFGAMLLLDPQHRHVAWPIVTAFTLATGLLGVFLAVPMKRQIINQEKLPFPSGIAAAVTLRSLHERSAETLRKAYALIVSMVAGAIIGVLNTAEDQFAALGRFFAWMRERLFDVHLPDLVPEQGLRLLAGKPMVAFGFEPSSLLIAAGMIIGRRMAFSIFAASAVLYFFVAPWLQGIDAAHAGEAGYIASIPTAGGGALFHPVRWALWGGVATMTFASFTALALQWRVIGRSFRGLRRSRPAAAGASGASAAASGVSADLEARMAAIEVPWRWFVMGVAPIAVALVLIQWLAFHIQWWAGTIAVAMSFVLALVCCRATGESDISPTGPLGKIMQLIFAVISPGNVVHNLAAAGAGANSASSAADLLTDLKSGYLLGANPRQQFLAQLTGLFFGTLSVVPAWYLLAPTAEALEKYPLPATSVWVAVAKVLSHGIDTLPGSAQLAILLGAALGILLPLADALVPRLRPYLPSAMGLGLGWVVFFNNALAFAIGAIIVMAWSSLHKRSEETFCVPVASGLIAGESILKALLAMLATAIGLSA